MLARRLLGYHYNRLGRRRSGDGLRLETLRYVTLTLLGVVVSQLVVTPDCLRCLENVCLLVTWMSYSHTKVDSRVAFLLGYSFNLGAQLGWALEHRTAPFPNIELTSGVKQAYHGPCHGLEALLH